MKHPGIEYKNNYDHEKDSNVQLVQQEGPTN